MSRWIFDIESDGLLDTITRTWIIGGLNLDTMKLQWWLEGDMGWIEALNNATLVVGHNVLGYDFPALEKVHGYKLPKHVKVHDTLPMSQALNYRRFPSGKHSLEAWGEFLGSPKGEFKDFHEYSERMLTYWKQDINLSHQIYRVVLKELGYLAERSPQIKPYIKAEHAVSKWCAQAELKGWPFKIEKAKEYFETMSLELEDVRSRLQPLLGFKTVRTDETCGVVEVKVPKWTKNGAYHHHTAKWFGIDPFTGQDDDRLIDGPYCRVEIEELDVDSVSDVKIFLFRNGWEPLEYNFVKDKNTGRKVQSSPKITEESLECMEGNGKVYCDFLTTKSRHAILKGWIKNTDKDGFLHGGCMTIGTPSMRARHNLIVNVPAADSVWGPEMRSLFGCLPGWKIVGCDSSGNQARGLAHYLKSPEYVDLLLNHDIHQYNADQLTAVLKDMGIDHVVPRGIAKRVLYAFLFGAAGAKMWSYIFNTPNVKKGNKLKKGFIKAVPGFQPLLDTLDNIYGKTSQSGFGYIPGIAGNKVYCDSFHKLLVYLLQACEKATCAAALMLAVEKMEEENIPYWPLIFMHDEIDFMVPEEYAERAAEIGKQAFIDGPKIFGIDIMSGESKIGENWYEVH